MTLDIETTLFIDGKFTPASDNGTFDVISPGSRNVVAQVSEATAEDVDRAVKAAKDAFPSWSSLAPEQREKPMSRLAALIESATKELANLEALSMGRPVSEYMDASVAAFTFRYFAQAGYNAQGRSSLSTPGFVNMVLRQPYGVVGAIIPWNVPLLFFAKKVAPALAAGNTVVIKSSEKAPLTSLKVASMIGEAGFPPGVLNVISGGGTAGAALASNMDVRCITFTGSLRTGRQIQKASADSNLKNVILELGGKSPAIVFDDADLNEAVKSTVHSVQWNSGQTCMANTRVYVQKNVADKFVAAFKERFASSVRLGDPTDPAVNHGPQADEGQHSVVLKYLDLGKKSGDMILGDQTAGGLYINPTIFTSTPENAQIMKEEVFGPVVNINIFETEAEVVEKANDTEYGLYASVFTNDVSRALRMASKLEAGTVGVNCTSPTGAKDMPFGGYKCSGVGREGMHESINNFLEVKTVLIKVKGQD